MLGISQTACYGEGSSLSIKMHKTELPRKHAFWKEKSTLHWNGNLLSLRRSEKKHGIRALPFLPSFQDHFRNRPVRTIFGYIATGNSPNLAEHLLDTASQMSKITLEEFPRTLDLHRHNRKINYVCLEITDCIPSQFNKQTLNLHTFSLQRHLYAETLEMSTVRESAPGACLRSTKGGSRSRAPFRCTPSRSLWGEVTLKASFLRGFPQHSLTNALI